MKALTLWQPWASLVAYGDKTIETRSWSTSYRGPLAIHAAKRRLRETDFAENLTRIDAAFHRRNMCVVDDLPLGMIVAVCNLVDVVPIIDAGLCEWHGDHARDVYVNPPYSDVRPWCDRAIAATSTSECDQVVMLLPAATDTSWFHEAVWPVAELLYLRGRVRFLGWRGTAIRAPRAPSLVAVYRHTAHVSLERERHV